MMNGPSASQIERALQRQPAQECPSAEEANRGAVREILAKQDQAEHAPHPPRFIEVTRRPKRRKKRKPIPKMRAGDLGLGPRATEESWGEALCAVAYWLVTRFGGGLLIGFGIMTGMRGALRWWLS